MDHAIENYNNNNIKSVQNQFYVFDTFICYHYLAHSMKRDSLALESPSAVELHLLAMWFILNRFNFSHFQLQHLDVHQKLS